MDAVTSAVTFISGGKFTTSQDYVVKYYSPIAATEVVMVPGEFCTMYDTVPGSSRDLERRIHKGATIHPWEEPEVKISRNVDKTILRADRLDTCLTQELKAEMLKQNNRT